MALLYATGCGCGKEAEPVTPTTSPEQKYEQTIPVYNTPASTTPTITQTPTPTTTTPPKTTTITPTQPQNLEAKLIPEITNIRFHVENGTTYYDYTLTIKETKGVGVNLTNAQTCYESIGCKDPVSVNYRIEANSQFSKELKWWTSFSKDKMTLKYSGKDDKGNDISVEFSLNHLINK